MDSAPHRVVVWGTGFVGKMVIREILDHPRFELVGVVVSDPAKDGRDVGEICAVEPIGIRASTDADAVLTATRPDTVAHYGPTAAEARTNIADLSDVLRRGIDVVSTAMTNFVWWPSADRWMVDPVREACREGAASCFTTGIDPGFANDLLPMTLTGVCGRVDRVRASEILDYASYTGDYAPMGFGAPPEVTALLEVPEVLIMAWGGTVPMMAEAMGVELDDITTTYQKWVTDEAIDYPLGTIEPGTVAAIRFTISGVVAGDERIVLEHVNRITDQAAPHWPRGRIAESDVYRVDIDGSPSISQETMLRGEGGDANAGGCLATGLRALNAVPAVVEADPGMLTALDLPLIPGAGTIR